MTTHLDNPAARLHNILSNLSGNAGNEAMSLVWARALNMHGASTDEVLAAMGRVYALPAEVSTRMQLIPGYRPRDVSRWWDNLSNAFVEMHFTAAWGNVQHKITRGMLEDIDSCAAKLEVFVHDPHLELNQIQFISDQVELIRNELNNATNIDNSLKLSLLFRLKRIEDALKLVHITGTTELQVELEAMTANVVAEAHKPDRTEQARNVLKTLGTGLGVVMNMINLWNTVNIQQTALPEAPNVPPQPGITLILNAQPDDPEIRRWLALPPSDDESDENELAKTSG